MAFFCFWKDHFSIMLEDEGWCETSLFIIHWNCAQIVQLS